MDEDENQPVGLIRKISQPVLQETLANSRLL